MPHYYIPFANSASEDWPLAASVFPDAAGCRVTLQAVEKAGSRSRPSARLWVDAGVDGLHWSRMQEPIYEANPSFKAFIRRFANHERIADPEFQKKPDKPKTIAFVSEILNAAFKAVPNVRWLSVPQLPYLAGSDRNRINRLMAEATLKWRSEARYRGRLILPVIFAKQPQTNNKTDRNPKVSLATECFEASGANGVWVVDSTLNDQAGVANFEQLRFPGIINFHEELNAKLPTDTVTVAGPYWGLNIILWARGLVRLLAVGTGRTYQYHIAGGMQKKGGARLALPPLKRLVQWSPSLREWLENSIRSLPRGDAAHAEFAGILRNIGQLQEDSSARQQVARFYKEWLERLELLQPTSRALTLYQEFSSAYVLGMKLRQSMPAPEEVRNPARIAKQFMVNCL